MFKKKTVCSCIYIILKASCQGTRRTQE